MRHHLSACVSVAALGLACDPGPPVDLTASRAPDPRPAPRGDGAGRRPPRAIPDPVPRDDLVMAVHLEKAEYKKGEPIVIVSEFQNLGADPVTLWECGFWPNHVVIVKDEQGQEPLLTPRGKSRREQFTLWSGERDANFRYVVKPGKSSKNRDVDLAELYDLRPGRYAVTVIYEDADGLGGPLLTVASKPTAFTVVD